MNIILADEKFWWEVPSFLEKSEEFVEKINSNEFRFKDADVLEIKNRSAVNLANTDFAKQVNLQVVLDIKRFGSFQKPKSVLS